MESQRVSLLTEGYLRGWLDFEYKNPGSFLREQYLLAQLQKEKLIELSRADVFVSAALASGVPSKEAYDKVFDARLNYFNALFPYAKIEEKKEVSVEEADFWRNFLTEKEKETK